MPSEHEFVTPMEQHDAPPSQRLTNDDFRKIMMTPRSTTVSSATTSQSATHISKKSSSGKSEGYREYSEKAENRRKKKNFYANLKKQEDDKMLELAAKYRDRARERRDGITGPVEMEGDSSKTKKVEETTAPGVSAAGYRAVAPDVKSNYDAAERRRQMIQESKFLGGDMEHTHLVKGLDFALLQKVRSEILNREIETENQNINKDSSQTEDMGTKNSEKNDEAEAQDQQDFQVTCRTNIAKNIIRTVFKTDVVLRNDLFFPGRMAYVIDLEDSEFTGDVCSDVPLISIRSKAECAGSIESMETTLSTNDIVINKLTQILSYLRSGPRGKKKKKDKLIQSKDSEAALLKIVDDRPIWDDVEPGLPIQSEGQNRNHQTERRVLAQDTSRNKSKTDLTESSGRHQRSYFDAKPESELTDEKKKRDAEKRTTFSNEDKQTLRALISREENKNKYHESQLLGKMSSNEHEGYAECYPGLVEMNDAIGDSDDEADFTKMDLGNKRGPLGRWDFDSAEEYAEYMSRKEALPKAAFQYGVKMSDGRKTRGKVGVRNEKAKIDKEWNKISALIEKRRPGTLPGFVNHPKKPKISQNV